MLGSFTNSYWRYSLNLLLRSGRTIWVLAKVTLPVMLLVRIGSELGWINDIGVLISPLMSGVGLPAEGGIIWAITVFTNIYGGIAAYLAFQSDLGLNSAQLNALCLLMLFAHGLPVEQLIVKRAGASFWFTTGLRVVTGILAAWVIMKTSNTLGVLQEPAGESWIKPVSLATTWAEWGQGVIQTFVILAVVVVALFALMDLLKKIGWIKPLTKIIRPGMVIAGVTPRLGPMTLIGILLGLSYGGGMIIEEARREVFSKRELLVALSCLSLVHSIIDDTLLMLALGANIWIVLVFRVVIGLILTGLLARLLALFSEPKEISL